MNRRFPSFTIIIIFILLILCGIPLIHYLNLELNPTAISSSLSVRFSWSGAEPRIIEEEATSKLEALFARVNGIRNISSTSGNGNGNINLTLDKEADPDAVRFEISTLIRQVWPDMPAGARFPSLSVNSSGQENRRPLITYKLNAPQSPPLVQQYADDHIKPALSQIPGINKIDIYGASPLEWIIEYDTEKLKSADITPGDIQNIVSGVKMIYIIDRDNHKSVQIANILFLIAEGNYTEMQLEGNNTITITRSLCELENRLNEHGFIRCHYSYIVNITRIESFCRKAKIINLPGHKIPISRSKCRDIFIFLSESGIKETKNHDGLINSSTD